MLGAENGTESIPVLYLKAMFTQYATIE